MVSDAELMLTHSYSDGDFPVYQHQDTTGKDPAHTVLRVI